MRIERRAYIEKRSSSRSALFSCTEPLKSASSAAKTDRTEESRAADCKGSSRPARAGEHPGRKTRAADGGIAAGLENRRDPARRKSLSAGQSCGSHPHSAQGAAKAKYSILRPACSNKRLLAPSGSICAEPDPCALLVSPAAGAHVFSAGWMQRRGEGPSG